MIEGIKMLLPLLESVSNGGAWLFGAYIVVMIIKVFAWFFGILFVVVKLIKLAEKISSDGIKDVCTDDGYDKLYGLVMQSKSTRYFQKEDIDILKDNIK